MRTRLAILGGGDPLSSLLCGVCGSAHGVNGGCCTEHMGTCGDDVTAKSNMVVTYSGAQA